MTNNSIWFVPLTITVSYNFESLNSLQWASYAGISHSMGTPFLYSWSLVVSQLRVGSEAYPSSDQQQSRLADMQTCGVGVRSRRTWWTDWRRRGACRREWAVKTRSGLPWHYWQTMPCCVVWWSLVSHLACQRADAQDLPVHRVHLFLLLVAVITVHHHVCIRWSIEDIEMASCTSKKK